MRIVDPSTLEPLGAGGLGPWRLGDDRIVKTSRHGAPLRTEEGARALFDAYRAAHEASASTPRPFEVVRAGDGFGVVLEYVRGLPLAAHLAFGSYSPSEAGQAMGELMRRLHGVRCQAGRDVNATFSRYARSLAPLLPAEVGDKLVALVDAVPNPGILLHCDIHPNNVIVRGGGHTLIDMEFSGFGHPVFDLACSRTRLLLNNDPLANDSVSTDGREGPSEDVARVVWGSLLEAYFEGATSDEVGEADLACAVLAEVEHCCFKFGIGHLGNVSLTEGQLRRAGLCAERLAALLPTIDRLDAEPQDPRSP